MKNKKFFLILLLFALICKLYAKPDLVINGNGDNIYGLLNTGKGGEYTYLNGKNGQFNPINVIIQNDNDADNNSEYYYINVKLPNNKWNYYFEYKSKKYEGEWATDSIKVNNSEIFTIYLKPPHSASAITYPIIINAISDNKTDSIKINFNVIQQENFDLILVDNNSISIGSDIYETNYFKNQLKKIFITTGDTSILNFNIENTGNIKGNYYLEFYSKDFSSNDFLILFNNKNVSNALSDKMLNVLDSGMIDNLSFYINGNKIVKNGKFYIKIYDKNLFIVDGFEIDIYTSNSGNINYFLDYNSTENDHGYLLLTNLTEITSNIQIMSEDKILNELTVNSFSQQFLEITSGKFKIKGYNYTLPVIINFDKNFCVSNVVFPEFLNFEGSKLLFPIILIFNKNEPKIYISNTLNKKSEIRIKVFSNIGKLIYEENKSIDSDKLTTISFENIKSDGLYWAEIESDSIITGKLVNKFGSCYIYYRGISIK